MWRFIEKAFAVITTFLNSSCLNPLECVSMNNQECKARAKVVNVNVNEPVFYPGSCNSINHPYAKLYIPNIIKNINVKVFNLMQRINEIRQIIWHETCKCVCRLTSSVCNNSQRQNESKCRYECREDLIDKGICDKGYIWNPSLRM